MNKLLASALAWGLLGAAGPGALAAGTLVAPALVSPGMAGVLASVPAQAGATYLWTVTGGAVTGPRTNAAVTFTAGPVGSVRLQCLVTVAGAATAWTRTIPVAPAPALTPAYYGSGFSADALANTVLGGPARNVVSYRFQARHASVLRAIRVFFIWSLLRAGYQAGGGGTIQVDLLADDGTAAHLPAGAPLATLSYSDIIGHGTNYPLLAFPYPAALAGGHLYHLVFTNVDPDPVDNYISLDDLYTDAQTAPMQPAAADATFAVLVRSGAGDWKVRRDFTPILELDYGDGGSQGNSYLEVWSGNPKPISGPAMVREAFKVSGPSRMFSRVTVRAQRLAGASPLTLRVEEADGTLVDQAQVPAAAFPSGVPGWATATFPLSHVLATGVAYHLVLSSPADTRYAAYPVRKGLDKGFSAYTCFPDGYAQFTATAPGGWAGWDMWGTPNLKTADLQFLFVP